MGAQGLISLLKCGTITRDQGGDASTIDLVLVSQNLANTMIHCKINDTDYSSDHLAIISVFDIEISAQMRRERLLFKEAPWQRIREAASNILKTSPLPTGTQEKCDRLIDAVSQAVQAHTPIARPSPYAKRWWNKELTSLRGAQSRLRNLLRRQCRQGIRDQELEQAAVAATRQYHKAIYCQKRHHWDKFVAEQENIWNAARFLDPDKTSAFAKVPPLIKNDGSVIEGEDQQADELLGSFFPPLPHSIAEEPATIIVAPIEDPELTLEEVKRKVFSAKPWKAPGRDGLPTIVWRQLWPVVKEEILDLFNSSLDNGFLPHQWREAKIIPLKKPGKTNACTFAANSSSAICCYSGTGDRLRIVDLDAHLEAFDN